MEIAPIEESPFYLAEHEKHLGFSTTTVVYISSYLGEIEVRKCNDCDNEDVRCMHIKNEVDTKKLTIVCLLCGG